MATTSSSRRVPRWMLGAAAVLALIALGFVVRGTGRASTGAPRTATVERGDIEITVSALGKIGPKTFVDVGAQVSGQLSHVHVEVGERVEQGQLLAEIDPRIFESRVEADRARIASLQAQSNERQASLELSRTQHARNQSLVGRGLIARDLVDTSGAQLKQSEAQLRSVQAQLKEAQSTLEGDVANLDYAKIYAPITGTVVSQTVLEGQTINANQMAPTLLRVANLDTMTVTAQVAEADIVRVVPGMAAWFSTLGQPKRRWQGTVRQILPTPDIVNEVVLYKVLIDVENKDGALLPDMTAQVFFQVDRADDTLTIPANAIAASVKGDGTGVVRVVGERGQMERREVRIGLRDRDQAQVLAGLRQGERVIVPDPAANPNAQGQRGFGLFGPRR